MKIEESTIAKITRAYKRTYTDSGETRVYVEWLDSDGKPGRTGGNESGWHIAALLARAKREGVKLETEIW